MTTYPPSSVDEVFDQDAPVSTRTRPRTDQLAAMTVPRQRDHVAAGRVTSRKPGAVAPLDPPGRTSVHDTTPGLPARGTYVVAVGATLGGAVVDASLTGGLGLVFDMVFVVTSVAAALTIHGRDLFSAAVLPPLVLAAAMALLALVARGVIDTDAVSFSQGFLSGLAHHAGWLVGAYAATLVIVVSRASSSTT